MLLFDVASLIADSSCVAPLLVAFAYSMFH